LTLSQRCASSLDVVLPPRGARASAQAGLPQRAHTATQPQHWLLFAATRRRELTGNQGVSTIPMACTQVGTMLASVPASQLMAKFGRRVGFLIGAGLFVCGGLLGALAMSSRSFLLQLVSVSLTGMGIGVAEYWRFAAAEVVPPVLKPRAIALTVAGSLVSAFAGPQIAKITRNMMDIEFQASYLSNSIIAALYLAIVVVMPGLPNALPPPPTPTSDAEPHKGRKGSLCLCCGHEANDSACHMYMSNRALPVATLSSAIGFGSMVLSMTATPLAMKAQGFSFEQSATTIQTHVSAIICTVRNSVRVNLTR
jgi:MFS family permease